MTQIEQQKAAKEFAEFWKDKGDEKQHTQQFWTSLLRDVYGVSSPEKVIDFEKRVKINGTKFIDGYISDTRVAIEQKGSKINLDKAERQSDKEELTPFGQAKRYDDNLPYSEKCRWIVVSNFTEFRIYDMESSEPEKEFETVKLCDLPKEFYRLQFLVDQKNENIRREEELSLKAGELVGKLYDALIKEYIDPDEKSLRSLNILCVRIVFCLYAEDAGLFDSKTAFEDYIKSFAIENLRDGIIKLFKALDSKERDKYDLKLKPFPYVNGGLFRDEQIEIPNFTQEIVDVIVNHCAPFNWSDISPTIFGAVFESTLNPETRRKGGMHYTSIQNIHKVIDPLFMDDLNAEFESICATKIAKQKTEKLHDFQAKLGSLKFLDPACGSGNFLTETYISLRRLENKVISILNKGETVLGFDEFIKVHINQFYGIEINDFAVTVAKTALWIAESQMIAETEAIISQNIDFLPLTTNAFIVEGNALRMDWSTLKPLEENALPKEGLFSGFTTETDGTKHEYDYIMGNPPFVGASMMDAQQKKEATDIFGKIHLSNSIDYVGAWYYKAADLIKGKNTKVAFVSTNSITQGEQVFPLWNSLLQKGLCIDFACRTFKWDSESSEKAAVHCVIIGFSFRGADTSVSEGLKRIYNDDGTIEKAKNINPYLIDAPNVLIESHGGTPLCNIPKMTKGNQPTDDGNFIFSEDEYNDFVAKYPKDAHLLHRYVGAKDFLNNDEVRYCLWLKDVNPAEFSKNKEIMRRLDAIKAFRERSSAEPTRKSALTPWRFFSTPQKNGSCLCVPEVSSERRKYIPIGFLDENTIASNKMLIVPDVTLFHFGVLMSSIHMAWMRVVSGRLKSDYQYSSAMVYNTFPWCNANDEQKEQIEKTAQAILDARAKYEGTTLAQLYGEHQYLYPELGKAHEANDEAVMRAYGFKQNMPESEIVAELFKMYEKLVNT